METTTMEAPIEARAAKTPLQAVDKSDLAGMIATAHDKANDAGTIADRLESLLAGLTGEDTGLRGEGAEPNSCGLGNLSDALDRTERSHNRASGFIDRLNSLIAL